MTDKEMKDFRKFLDVFAILMSVHAEDFPHWKEYLKDQPATPEIFVGLLEAGNFYLKQFYVDLDEIEEMGYKVESVPDDFLPVYSELFPRSFEFSKSF